MPMIGHERERKKFHRILLQSLVQDSLKCLVVGRLLENLVAVIVSMQRMVKYLDIIADEKIPAVNIPTRVPLVYKLDDALVPVE